MCCCRSIRKSLTILLLLLVWFVVSFWHWILVFCFPMSFSPLEAIFSIVWVSLPLVVPAGCCVASRHATLLSSHCLVLPPYCCLVAPVGCPIISCHPFLLELTLLEPLTLDKDLGRGGAHARGVALWCKEVLCSSYSHAITSSLISIPAMMTGFLSLLHCHRAFCHHCAINHCCPCAVYCRCWHRIDVMPSIAVAVTLSIAIAITPSIAVVAVASPLCYPSSLLPPHCCHAFHHCCCCAIHCHCQFAVAVAPSIAVIAAVMLLLHISQLLSHLPSPLHCHRVTVTPSITVIAITLPFTVQPRPPRCQRQTWQWRALHPLVRNHAKTWWGLGRHQQKIYWRIAGVSARWFDATAE